MDISEIIMKITELTGVIVCAISGSMISIDRKLDAVGVVIIGCVTAVGGGLIRDIIIGRTPPAVFSNEYILITAALTSLLTFIAVYFFHNIYNLFQKNTDAIINFLDAIGLAAFTIIGTEAAKNAGFYDNMLLAVTLGTITGVGGGVLRDTLTNVMPYILRKHIYAVASVVGSILYYILDISSVPRIFSVMLSISTVVIIRLLASKYRWNMPKINLDK